MNKDKEAPNCYECQYRGEIAGDCHSHCMNKEANVVGDDYGKRSGWFKHPWNFDPVWLISCDGFKPITELPTAGRGGGNR